MKREASHRKAHQVPGGQAATPNGPTGTEEAMDYHALHEFFSRGFTLQ